MDEFNLAKHREMVANMTLAEARDYVATHYSHEDMRQESDKAIQMLLDCADKVLKEANK